MNIGHGQLNVNKDPQNGRAKTNGAIVSKFAKDKPRRAKLAESEGAIGAGLRSLYQDVIKEPLPDDLMALLDKLGSTDSDDE